MTLRIDYINNLFKDLSMTLEQQYSKECLNHAVQKNL